MLAYPTTSAELAELVRREAPEAIVHLAGYTHPGRSFSEPLAAWHGNLTLTLDLLAAVVQSGLRPRVLLVSSAAVYGEVAGTITEETPLAPLSPYGSSKAAMEALAQQVGQASRLPIVRVRTFNLCGPGLPIGFALGDFTRQLIDTERGLAEPVLKVGNLSAERDYLDVRDAVAGYGLLLEKGQPGEAYNLARGEAHAMRWFVEELIRLCPKEVRLQTEVDRFRPAEARRSNVDIGKVRALGWSPRIELIDSLRGQMEAARAAVEATCQPRAQASSPQLG